jgi:putative component of membrane protein insertase Oxa1/YidC/SpoIIIJ protein YidD
MCQISIFSPRNQAIATLKPGIIDALAIAAITGYQRYLSPHKGFRCAHRVLHQGESCSQYVKREVQEEGLRLALRRSRLRFAECKEASWVIKTRCREYLISLSSEDTSDTNWDPPTPLTDAEKQSLQENEQQRINNNAASSNNCNDCDSPCIDAGCESANCLSAVDCASCDLAGLDCGVLDVCGGCSW